MSKEHLPGLLQVLCLLLLFISCGSPQYDPSPPIQFRSEDITITIHASEALVEGTYSFKNLDKEKKLVQFFYPFPVDEDHLYPHSMEVRGLQFKRGNGGIFWTMELDSLEEKEAMVRYEQMLLKPNVKYILTTTRAWKRPLERARFTVIVPATFEEVSLSYPPDSVCLRGNRAFYYLYKSNFSPETDLEISWSNPDTTQGSD